MDDKKLELTERELQAIRWALTYLNHFSHGAAGHNDLIVLAKLALHMGFEQDGDLKLSYPDSVKVTFLSPRPG